MRKMQNPLKGGLASAIAGLLYPSRCPICERVSDSFALSPICRACWAAAGPYGGPSCGVCARPLVSEHCTVCGDCLSEKPPYSKAVSYGLYSGALKEAIHALKFSGIRRLARPLGRLLLEVGLPRADVLVPVPQSIRGLRERGFNQSALISGVYTKASGVGLSLDLLLKGRETPPQTGLSRTERKRNLKGAFYVSGGLSGERVLLFDDVMTTGATAEECARTLLKAGAGEVYVATVARAG